MVRCASLLALAALSLAFAPAPLTRRDSSKEDLKKIQGEWVRVHYTINGKLTGGECWITIAGTLLRYGNNPGSDEWTISIDARKKTKMIDLVSFKDKKKTYRGIYRLQEDTLTIYSRASPSEKDRPTRFDPSQGNLDVEVFKRRKR
jgi:uncharacterized protein (TIGR03067 family)